MNTLTNDETVPVTNLDEDSELPRMLTILNDSEEVMKGRQKELNSLKEMGVMTTVKRTTAAGKRVIQKRRCKANLSHDGQGSHDLFSKPVLEPNSAWM